MSLALDELPRDPDQLLQIVRQMAEVVARQNASLVSLQAEHDTALAERDGAQAEVENLRLLIRQLQRGRFGRRSEKLDPDQLQLGLEDLEQAAAAAEAAQEAATKSSDAPRPPRSRRRNLGALPAHLPRVEVLVDVEDKACPCCGGAMHAVGEDTSEMLDIVPAQLRVKVIRRPRYACRACEEAVVQAPAPERPISGGMATEALLAHVLVAKYGDFLPLYRQAGIFARQGIDLDRSTLCDWVGRACWWLEPLWRLLHRHVMASTRIFADDTPLPVLDPGRGRTKTGRLWGYAIDNRPWGGGTPPAVVYLYAEDRKGEHPAAHLAGFRGVLQVDGYGGYKSLLTGRPPGEIRLAFCCAHCRRRFYETHQATGSPLAGEALRRIGELYAIEAEIRGRPAEERRAVRQERSRPLVDALHSWLTAQLARVPGKSGLAEAIRYALRHWQGLVLFLDDGRLEPDTNTVERAIRPVVLGRKNHLFAGSDGGARWWAIVASLVATASRVGDWRGGGRTRGVAVGRWLSPAAGASARAVAPSLVAARQTGRAACPHPAFTCVLKPSRSAGRHGGVAGGRGRAPRTDARPGIGGTRCLAGRSAASTIVGPVARRTGAPGRRSGAPALG